MPAGELGTMDMTPIAVANYHRQHLDALVCLGGSGTQKNALHLLQHGLNVITLPKTIDNDVARTDVTFGFDTAMGVATEAIDRLHSTAESHHRIIIVEIMGHNAGWLTLVAGVAGGADVILIPEIPYKFDAIAEAVLGRSHTGKRFSIIAMAEGALSKEEAKALKKAEKARRKAKEAGQTAPQLPKEAPLEQLLHIHESVSVRLARRLEELTGLESRVTSLGHLQRGGPPSPADRLLATRLGTACAQLIAAEQYGVMVAVSGDECVPVPLAEVAGNCKTVPVDHPWIASARMVGTSFGDCTCSD